MGTLADLLEERLVERFNVENLSEGVDPIEGMKFLRQDAFRSEADPIFFKVQRGEATLDEWNSAIEAIRTKFPYEV